MNNPQGVSLIKINTEKGKVFFEGWKDELELVETTYSRAFANKNQMIQLTGVRGRFMNYVDEKPIDELLLTFNRTKKGGIKGI